MPIAVVVLGLVLASFFRNLLGVALPLAVTGITVAWTLGCYQLAGLEVNAITALLPPILMVLSLGVSIHLIQGWLDASDAAVDRATRIQQVVRRLVFPCFFCTLTTAIGFGSLVTSNMPAVQQFGVFAALGVVIAFFIGMTLVPVGLTFFEPPSAPLRTAQHRLIRTALDWAARVSVDHPWRVLAIFAGITVISLAGLPLVRNNTDLVRFLKSDAAALSRHDVHRLAPVRRQSTLEFVVARRDAAPLVSQDAVQRMAAFEQAVLAHPEVTGVLDILAVLRQLQRGEVGRRGAGASARRARHRLRVRSPASGARAGLDPQTRRARLHGRALQRPRPRRRHFGRRSARRIDPRRRVARRSVTSTASRPPVRSTG